MDPQGLDLQEDPEGAHLPLGGHLLQTTGGTNPTKILLHITASLPAAGAIDGRSFLTQLTKCMRTPRMMRGSRGGDRWDHWPLWGAAVAAASRELLVRLQQEQSRFVPLRGKATVLGSAPRTYLGKPQFLTAADPAASAWTSGCFSGQLGLRTTEFSATRGGQNSAKKSFIGGARTAF